MDCHHLDTQNGPISYPQPNYSDRNYIADFCFVSLDYYHIHLKTMILLVVEIADVMSQDNITEYLAEHPRMIGVLFTMFLLLSQAGNVAAGASGTVAGP